MKSCCGTCSTIQGFIQRACFIQSAYLNAIGLSVSLSRITVNIMSHVAPGEQMVPGPFQFVRVGFYYDGKAW
jgi:hypothetical protein